MDPNRKRPPRPHLQTHRPRTPAPRAGRIELGQRLQRRNTRPEVCMKRFWRTLFRRSRVDSDIAEEIQSHLALRADLERQSGLSAPDAHASARRKFGNATLVMEDTRQFHIVPFLESILQDLNHALRQ